MVKLLEATDADLDSDALEATMTEAEEKAAHARFAPTAQTDRHGNSPDLSDGGMVNGARITPMTGGRPTANGRAAARRAWTWNGTETVLPLAWDTDGKVHDGGRRYLLKRWCLCCNWGGFRGRTCPQCRKNACVRCQGSTSQKPQTLQNGKTINGFIIPVFYLQKDDVPFQTRFYGNVNCMIATCPRNGEYGFQTEEDMRMHARLRHRMEYQIRQETAASRGRSETQELREMVNALTLQLLQQKQAPVVENPSRAEPVAGRKVAESNTGEAFKARMAKARAAKKQLEASTIP